MWMFWMTLDNFKKAKAAHTKTCSISRSKHWRIAKRSGRRTKQCSSAFWTAALNGWKEGFTWPNQGLQPLHFTLYSLTSLSLQDFPQWKSVLPSTTPTNIFQSCSWRLPYLEQAHSLDEPSHERNHRIASKKIQKCESPTEFCCIRRLSEGYALLVLQTSLGPAQNAYIYI